jgi:hypothetical protein
MRTTHFLIVILYPHLYCPTVWNWEEEGSYPILIYFKLDTETRILCHRNLLILLNDLGNVASYFFSILNKLKR